MADKKCPYFKQTLYTSGFFDAVCDDMLMEEKDYCSKLCIECPHCNGDPNKCMEEEYE